MSSWSRRGRVSATRGDEAKLTRARKLVAESPLAARAAALIGSMEFGPTSPIAPLLLSTRAFLMGFSDDASGLRQVNDWMRQARLRTRIVRASFGELTATECWNEYTKEAIAAWIEFEDCMNNVKWWDPFGTTKCTLIYDLRALAAFAWWLDCSKLANLISG